MSAHDTLPMSISLRVTHYHALWQYKYEGSGPNPPSQLTRMNNCRYVHNNSMEKPSLKKNLSEQRTTDASMGFQVPYDTAMSSSKQRFWPNFTLCCSPCVYVQLCEIVYPENLIFGTDHWELCKGWLARPFLPFSTVSGENWSRKPRLELCTALHCMFT